MVEVPIHQLHRVIESSLVDFEDGHEFHAAHPSL